MTRAPHTEAGRALLERIDVLVRYLPSARGVVSPFDICAIEDQALAGAAPEPRLLNPEEVAEGAEPLFEAPPPAAPGLREAAQRALRSWDAAKGSVGNAEMLALARALAATPGEPAP
jgi:hypothetical protein